MACAVTGHTTEALTKVKCCIFENTKLRRKEERKAAEGRALKYIYRIG